MGEYRKTGLYVGPYLSIDFSSGRKDVVMECIKGYCHGLLFDALGDADKDTAYLLPLKSVSGLKRNSWLDDDELGVLQLSAREQEAEMEYFKTYAPSLSPWLAELSIESTVCWGVVRYDHPSLKMNVYLRGVMTLFTTPSPTTLDSSLLKGKSATSHEE